MKCPLRRKASANTDGGFDNLFLSCIKEECAWWVKASQSCAVEAIPRIIGYLGSELKRIHHELCLSKYTYRCHNCGVTIEKTAAGEVKWPVSWTWQEQVDGKHVWLCDRCSPEGK